MAEGSSNGANNFLTDTAGSAASSQSKGRDFTKESREQKTCSPETIDKTSVPQGGMLPFGGGDKWAGKEEGADGGIEPGTTPFKNLK
jgi:hypothetical protein